MRAVDTGEDAVCSGHDYRQALEIAIALKQSAHHGHGRISLPLEDRSLKIYPHPYRLKAAMWQVGKVLAIQVRQRWRRMFGEIKRNKISLQLK